MADAGGATEFARGGDGLADGRNVHRQKPAQDEFGFGEMESRGHFEKTDRNLFDGQDLDVPTYLRRGIKISL
jgi:cell division protein FtsZ